MFILTLSAYLSYLFSGLKVIKTETIEKIHESDEGSMQNVGMLHDCGNFLYFIDLHWDPGINGCDFWFVCGGHNQKLPKPLACHTCSSKPNSTHLRFG